MPTFRGRVEGITQVDDKDWSGYVIGISCADPPDAGRINVMTQANGVFVFDNALVRGRSVTLVADPIGYDQVPQVVWEHVTNVGLHSLSRATVT
jgi:hypothetical protein